MIVDSLLIVLDKCDEKLFHFYSVEKMQYMGGFGHYGKGPSEFFDPELMHGISLEGNNLEFLVSEPNLNKVSSLNIVEGLSGEAEFVSSTISLPRLLSYPDQLSLIDDSLITGNCSHCVGRVFIYNIPVDTIGWVDFFPTISIATREDKLSELYNSIIKVSNEHKRIVSAMMSFERIDVFDIKGLLNLSIIVDNDNPEPDFSDVNRLMSDDTFQYYVDLFLTDRYIYCLSLNTQQKDLINNYYRDSKIHVFTWSGEAVVEIELDELATRFAVDEKHRRIYAICPLLENQLVTYKLPVEL